MIPPAASATPLAGIAAATVAPREFVHDAAFDLNKVGHRLIMRLGDKNVVAFQGALIDGTWGTAVLTVKVSCDPEHSVWTTHPTGTYVLNTSTKVTYPIEVDGYLWVCIEVTTAEGAAAIAQIWGSASAS